MHLWENSKAVPSSDHDYSLCCGYDWAWNHGEKKTWKNNKNKFLLTKLFLFQWISIHWLPFSLAAHQLRTCEVGWNLEFTKFFFLPSSDSSDSGFQPCMGLHPRLLSQPLSSDIKAVKAIVTGENMIGAAGTSSQPLEIWTPRSGSVAVGEGCQKSSLPTLEK